MQMTQFAVPLIAAMQKVFPPTTLYGLPSVALGDKLIELGNTTLDFSNIFISDVVPPFGLHRSSFIRIDLIALTNTPSTETDIQLMKDYFNSVEQSYRE